ncbi:heparinase II/III domain-containing protein [Chryseobacterium scophthalmum]|uniref:Heparinase II/III N-terminus n=1 Tax=Chryseobacterium scophthalmum TaxID=59733 RepID=A0A1N6I930_9FLAO|nr:heparinase II/III family protein [Chryseobacterium scophthalmum]SIO28526.1 Heparinase II/III N-terminus [Chryseobacterium scophthalmum]
MNLKLAIQLYKNMGTRYVAYRVRHEFEKKTGQLKKKHPYNLSLSQPISLADWKASKKEFLIDAKEKLQIQKINSQQLKEKAEKIISGELLFFNANWLSLGKDYNWITNPSNGYQYDSKKHWSEIPDLSEEAGDIKFVWEKSRFSYLLTLIRYDYHFDQDLSEFIFSEIDSWIIANPINQGPNWRCSQEISLRIFNWCFALYYYQNSAALTEERWQKIQNVMYASLHHVYHHIDFSRIAVRNNHAITETLFLSLSNILFPFIPEAKKWSEKGLKWFEEEINYQIYNDGTFLQFSMNYHRVVIQLLSFGISLTHKNNFKFSDVVYDKAYKSLNFLYQCMQDENGKLPNYGSNDGALFFPLADADYRDYRPQLNTLHYILTGKSIFENKEIEEDLCWNGKTFAQKKFKPITKLKGTLSFEDGGYYLCRNDDFFTFIRCGNHKDRPAQADNLHLDIWYKEHNILRDSGTYKYNTDAEKLKYFMGSLSHNVVMVNDESQMLKGGRFIWYFWSQKLNAEWRETETEYLFTGRIKAFEFLNKSAFQDRTIRVSKINPQWIVEDNLQNLDDFSMKQIWHPNDNKLNIESDKERHKFDSFNSDYYGNYTNEKSVYFKFNKNISTIITYNLS